MKDDTKLLLLAVLILGILIAEVIVVNFKLDTALSELNSKGSSQIANALSPDCQKVCVSYNNTCVNWVPGANNSTICTNYTLSCVKYSTICGIVRAE